MDADADTNLIASELMAVQGILMCVLRRVAAIDQNLASAIESGLDDATNLAEEMKVALGEEATVRRSGRSAANHRATAGRHPWRKPRRDGLVRASGRTEPAAGAQAVAGHRSPILKVSASVIQLACSPVRLRP